MTNYHRITKIPISDTSPVTNSYFCIVECKISSIYKCVKFSKNLVKFCHSATKLHRLPAGEIYKLKLCRTRRPTNTAREHMLSTVVRSRTPQTAKSKKLTKLFEIQHSVIADPGDRQSILCVSDVGNLCHTSLPTLIYSCEIKMFWWK